MQLEHDTTPPRHERRALLSGQRTRIQKRTAFGRAIVLAVEYGAEPQDSRIVYQHMTKGVFDGRRRMGGTGSTPGRAASQADACQQSKSFGRPAHGAR